MDNNNQLQQQQLVKKLLVILLSGLVSVLLLGVLLYLDDKQGFLAHFTLLGNDILSVLYVAGTFMGLFMLAQYRHSAKRYFLNGVGSACKHFSTVAMHMNGLLFGLLVMAILVTTRTGSVDTQQFFFLSLLSAVTGMMLARVWNGLTAQKSEA